MLDAQPLVKTPVLVKALRQAAPPQHLSADAWSRVWAVPVTLGMDVAERDAVATEQEQTA